MDDCDLTEERRAAMEEADRKHAAELEARRLARPSQVDCIDCEEPLTPFRQFYRCDRCVECQTLFEKSVKTKGARNGRD